MNSSKLLDIFDNKSKFAEFMTKNFPSNFPVCFYYCYKNENNLVEFVNDNDPKCVIIKKPNYSTEGAGIEIIIEFDKFEDKFEDSESVITEYVEHTIYYVGHFLVSEGSIIKKKYFSSNKFNSDKYYIKRGSIENYEILENIGVDETLFDKVYGSVNYSGFSCIDFVIKDNVIIIFEVNPRIGGSLLKNPKVLNEFLEYCEFVK